MDKFEERDICSDIEKNKRTTRKLFLYATSNAKIVTFLGEGWRHPLAGPMPSALSSPRQGGCRAVAVVLGDLPPETSLGLMKILLNLLTEHTQGRADEARLTDDIIELADQYGRYGYRMVTGLLNNAGWCVNHKRVERIWRRERLKVLQKQKKRDGFG